MESQAQRGELANGEEGPPTEPLQIKSVVAVEGLKGYIYVEAYKQQHVKQAISNINALMRGKLGDHFNSRTAIAGAIIGLLLVFYDLKRSIGFLSVFLRLEEE